MITERSSQLDVSLPATISKQMGVFYNPAMMHNRDISILVLKALKVKKWRYALPLAGSGVRGIRLLKELPKGMIDEVVFNDYHPDAVKRIKKNIFSNNLRSGYSLEAQDANEFLLSSTGFDYIDLDPFGTPNPFLDAACKRIGRSGMLAVSATDTSALCGTYPKACARKYWATPSRGAMMHEIGLRILIRKVQLIAAQYEKALVPIYAFSKDHYMRVFFRCSKGKKEVDTILQQHDSWDDAGPLWMGRLWEQKLAEKVAALNQWGDLQKFLDAVAEESAIDAIGYYPLAALIKGTRIGQLPKEEMIITAIKKKRKKVARSHFAPNSLRTTMKKDALVRLIRAL